MYQTYQEKCSTLLITITTGLFAESVSHLKLSPQPERLSLKEYHDIISRDNVIVVEAPSFLFNFAEMKMDNTRVFSKANINSFTDATNIHLQVETFQGDYTDFKWDEDTIYFFYTGEKLGNKYKIRITSVQKSILQPAIDRFEAIQRINTNFSLTSAVETVRSYVESPQFEADKILAAQDIYAIAKQINIDLKLQETTTPITTETTI